jgi:hypothetical protein
MHKNYTYTIKKFNATGFILTDELTGHDFHVADEVILSKFSLAYANTCHSSQGDSIDEVFVVCDYNMNKHVARHWVYTAVSRTRSMKNVFFLSANIKHRSDEETNHSLAEKVGDYARQDRAKGRQWARHLYITVQWIRDAYFAYEGKCSHCKCVMSYMSGCRKQVTVDRIKDDIAHIMSNCVLACLDCNRAHENLKHLNVD